MSDLSLHDLSKKMAKLDFTMMATRLIQRHPDSPPDEQQWRCRISRRQLLLRLPKFAEDYRAAR